MKKIILVLSLFLISCGNLEDILKINNESLKINNEDSGKNN